jgi:hypothetical protein
MKDKDAQYALDVKISQLNSKYAEKVASQFYNFGLEYYSEKRAKRILMKEFELNEVDANLVIPEINKLIMINLANKTPGYKKLKGITTDRPPKVTVGE